jgi:hypothetical protein
MILLVKLLLAHLLGDFVLQPDAWVKEKELKKDRSPKLYLHAIVHGALAFFLVWDPSFVLAAILITVTHFLIDLAKALLQRPDNRLAWFTADQALHFLVLLVVWYAREQPILSTTHLPVVQILIMASAAVMLTSPASALIKLTISHWTPETLYNVSSSLPDAGKFIGYLERLLVLTFVLFHHWEAVGFLLAAKSVFRFGDLRDSHDRKLTEYVLIGTLLSFFVAIMVSVAASVLLSTEKLFDFVPR